MGKFGRALGKLREAFDPHPALRASLSQWERESLQQTPRGRSFAEELRYLGSRWRKEPDQLTLDTSDILPPGETESTPLGSHYTIRVIYPHDYFHGKVRVSRLSPSDLQAFMTLMDERGTVPSQDRIIFLDTETTGVQSGAGICPFLVGLGYFSGDEFHILQYFLRDFDEEPSMLYALSQLMERFDMVVTYNGAAFDIPLLEARFTLARLDSPFRNVSHLDLLFSARRLWRNGHGSCRLIALEREMISFMRGPDVPGSMIPRAYFDYLQHKPSPTLKGVFSHNVYDVVSLAALTIHACDRVVLEPAALDDPLDLYSLGRILQSSQSWLRSIQLYEMALAGGLPGPTKQKALENLSVVHRRAGNHKRSMEICAELMALQEFSMTGYEGAAIYYGRVARDFESALRVVEEGLRRADTDRCKAVLQLRWDRLQQKVMVW
jgi:uncharacterized protein YprB with RNaseH-like and TPR domain